LWLCPRNPVSSDPLRLRIEGPGGVAGARHPVLAREWGPHAPARGAAAPPGVRVPRILVLAQSGRQTAAGGGQRIYHTSVDPPPLCRYRLPPSTARSGVEAGREACALTLQVVVFGARARAVRNPSESHLSARHPPPARTSGACSVVNSSVRRRLWPSAPPQLSVSIPTLPRPLAQTVTRAVRSS